MTKQPPEGLKRYFEWTARGARTGRAAYVLKREICQSLFPVLNGLWIRNSTRLKRSFAFRP
jgi:hypothetical protein